MMMVPESTTVQKLTFLSTLFGFAEARDEVWKTLFSQLLCLNQQLIHRNILSARMTCMTPNESKVNNPSSSPISA